MSNLCLLTLVLLAIWSEQVSSEIYFKKGAPHVKLANNGLISGVVKFSRDGRPYNSFIGFPYASAERFQPAQLYKNAPWTGVRSAAKPGDMCLQQQFEAVNGPFFGTEDCLNMNVYVPMNSTSKKGYPVMVWIHGGGFTYGTGVEFGAKKFMDEDVILITINYRLGVFGFLSTGDEIIPGNVGLKDQVVALEWVKENIKAFGGDPNKVTIFGESAGAASVHYLLLSPLAKGLFHRAIAQSGSALAFWAYQSNPKDNAARLATYLKCETTAANPKDISSQEILTCLKGLSAEELNKAQFAYKTSWPSNFRNFFFVPTAEPQPQPGSTHQPIITEPPTTAMFKDKYLAEVPTMFGVNEDEGCVLYSGIVLKQEELVTELDKDWNTIAPAAANYDAHFTPEHQQILTDEFRKFYFGDKAISYETRDNLTNFYSDQVTHAVYRAALETASKGKRHPVYLFQYAYPGPISVLGFQFQVTSKETEMVGHADEMQHLFNFSDEPTSPNDDDPHVDFSKNFVKLWTSFAYRGEPKHMWGSISYLEWHSIHKREMVGLDTVKWFRIDNDPLNIHNPYTARMNLWDDLLTRTGYLGTTSWATMRGGATLEHKIASLKEASSPPVKTEL